MATAVLHGCALTSSVPSNEQVRARWLAPAHEGDARAQFEVARTYRDATKALKWYCRAALQGYVPAQTALGDLFSNSGDNPAGSTYKSVKVDFVAAYMWYTVAAAQGNERAFNRRQQLGNMMDPNNVVLAKRNAARWTQQTCK